MCSYYVDEADDLFFLNHINTFFCGTLKKRNMQKI